MRQHWIHEMTYPLVLSLTAVVGLILGCGALIRWRQRRSQLRAPASSQSQVGSDILSLPPSFLRGKLPVTLSPSHKQLARVSGLQLREAEDLLDSLEQHGHKVAGVVCDAHELFTVEFHLEPNPTPALQIQPPRSSAG
jgi:hypothetical protein